MGEHQSTEHEPKNSGSHLAVELLEQAKPPEQAKGSDYQFVFCVHRTVEQGAEAVRSLKEVDIVGVEAIGYDSMEEREAVGRRWSEALLPSAPSGQLDQLIQSLSPFYQGILRELAGSGKQIALLDVPETHEAMAIGRKYDEMFDDYLQSLRAALPNAVSAQILSQLATLMAEENQLREPVVIGQLKELGNQASKPSRIGAILGMHHTPVQHELHREGYKTERSFIQPTLEDPYPAFFLEANETARYSLLSEAMRWRRLRPNEPFKPGTFNRIMLADIYASSGLFTQDDILAESANIARSLSVAEIDQMMAEIDSIKEQHRAMSTPEKWLRSAREKVLKEPFWRFQGGHR